MLYFSKRPFKTMFMKVGFRYSVFITPSFFLLSELVERKLCLFNMSFVVSPPS